MKPTLRPLPNPHAPLLDISIGELADIALSALRELEIDQGIRSCTKQAWRAASMLKEVAIAKHSSCIQSLP